MSICAPGIDARPKELPREVGPDKERERPEREAKPAKDPQGDNKRDRQMDRQEPVEREFPYRGAPVSERDI